MADIIVSKKFAKNLLAPLRHLGDGVPPRRDEPDRKNRLGGRDGIRSVEQAAAVLPVEPARLGG